MHEGIVVGDDLVDLRKLLVSLWRRKLIIGLGAVIFAVLSGWFVVSLPNIYRAQALLAPADDAEAGLSSVAGRLGGIASLAGLNFGRKGSEKTMMALEVMKSRSFLSDFIKRRGLLIPLIAGVGWDPKNEELLYDKNKYDVEKGEWVSTFSDSKGFGKLEWRAYKKISGMLKVEHIKDTGLVSVSMEYFSPVLAQQWLQWLIDDTNNQMRKRDVDEADKSILYLKKQLDSTSVAGMQQIFYQLIEKQMQTAMLASVREQYVFKVVDQPLLPEEKVGPKRALIVICSVVFGVVVVAMAVLVYELATGNSYSADKDN